MEENCPLHTKAARASAGQSGRGVAVGFRTPGQHAFLCNYIPSSGAFIWRTIFGGALLRSGPCLGLLIRGKSGNLEDILFYTHSVLSIFLLLRFPLSLPSCPRVLKRQQFFFFQSSSCSEMTPSICADMSVSCPVPFSGGKWNILGVGIFFLALCLYYCNN